MSDDGTIYVDGVGDVPSHLVRGLLVYGLAGHLPPDFLTAVLHNSLADAVARADETSLRHLKDVVAVAYNRLPGMSWGSPEKVAEWVEGGGWEGRDPNGTRGLPPELNRLRLDVERADG